MESRQKYGALIFWSGILACGANVVSAIAIGAYFVLLITPTDSWGVISAEYAASLDRGAMFGTFIVAGVLSIALGVLWEGAKKKQKMLMMWGDDYLEPF